MKKRVLILCRGDSCRSQMAQGLWRAEANGEWEVQSAGSNPVGYVHPMSIQVMSEVGIDISQNQSKHFDPFTTEPFDLVWTMCELGANGRPAFPQAKQMVHAPIDDPSHVEGSDVERMSAFRGTREQIAAYIRTWLAESAGETAAVPTDAPDSDFIDRDLSWLEFNRRVLHEAMDQRTPLLERLFFLGIFTSNLDEFFMKRVGRSEPGNRERLKRLRAAIVPMLDDQAKCFREDIRPELDRHGVRLLNWTEMTDTQREEANRYFRKNVFPVLTPQAVDPSHPFPFISNLSDSLVVALRYPNHSRTLFARVKIPPQLPQWFDVGSPRDGQYHFASLREVIRQHLGSLFPGMDIADVLPIRVTRGAGVDIEHVEAEDMLEQVEEELKQRRMQSVVRLEHTADPNTWLLDQVVQQLKVTPEQIYELPGELDYTDFTRIASLPIESLRFPPWTPVRPAPLSKPDTSIFEVIQRRDLLVHHPYESFDASVARFIRCAVHDDNVLAIRMTLYRTSDDTPFIPWLIQASESGKQVTCLVELKARFDEHRNIRWANALEDAGVHVVYGVVGMKTHTKTALVVRRESDEVRCYAHIGTGNYHPKTARLYTDLGLFTADPELTEDVVELFHYLTGRSLKTDYGKLLVAPDNMKKRFLEMIHREIDVHQSGRPARIVAKMNQLHDRHICRALYRASQAGVPIDLIIRGFCVLRPGVPDLSPTIRVISVIGRFLEHSRIYYFCNGAEEATDGEFFIGSADWMHRNLEDRIEAVTPIREASLRRRLWQILQIMLNDHRQAWDMHHDGTYTQRRASQDSSPTSAAGTHETLIRMALNGR